MKVSLEAVATLRTLVIVILLIRRVDAARFQCSWHVNETSTGTGALGVPLRQSIDLSFKVIARSLNFSWPKRTEDAHLGIELSTNEHHQLQSQDFGSTEAFRFVLDCLSAADHRSESFATLVVPRSSGYIARSDIIALRLIDCALVTSAVSFSKPHQFFDGNPISFENLQQLPNVFAASVGGMLLKAFTPPGSNRLESSSEYLESELRNRLSFPWLSMQEPKRLTLAIIEGGRTGPDQGGVGESIYTAAAALGIDMVVFDNPGHWLQDPRYTHWYKTFVPLQLDLHPDSKFTSDIVNAVRLYEGHVDGILTSRDHYKVYVAEAAVQLGLPTDPPAAYEIATDKFKTSVSEGHHAYQATSIEQALSLVQEHNLEFPLIIKPSNGFLSEGVFRVENLSQLEEGIKGINTERHGLEFVIEKYCDGPEVDANMVLCDEKLIFFEASDDFPKSADVNGQGNIKTFIELANVLPSDLPEYELEILEDSLTQSLVRMGFKDGFFHLEARVENSAVEYVTTRDVLDLAERSVSPKGPPSSWLIEVNPRPPGIQATEASKHTYGIDYWGLALLFALNDKHRVKQLSHPFTQGSQYFCEMVFIPVLKGGVYESGDVCAELFARRPDLADHALGSFCFLKKGDCVPDPATGVNAWVAYFNVFCRGSRRDVLETAETIRRECKFSIV
jgi:ATP-grasp N-terminal domain/ATP-grasp domain